MNTPSRPDLPLKSAPWRRILLTVVVMCAALAAFGAYRSASSHGIFAKVPQNSGAKCTPVHGIAGVDDIALDRKNGIAFLAVTDHRAARAGKRSDRDGIYAYAYMKSGAVPVKLAGNPKHFHPHALSLMTAEDGSMTLLAVNYGPNHMRSVDSFAITVKDGVPALKESSIAQSGLLVSPHAMAGVGLGYYYLTNDHMVKSDAARWIDDHFVLPRTTILYFDGSKFTVAAQKLNFPSGIVVSPDGNHVYVAERYARKLVTFERDPLRGVLKQVGEMNLPANPGQMTLGTDGSLWLAGMPKPYAYGAFKRDAASKAPSVVWHVMLKDGVPEVLDQVFADDGGRLSAAEVAAEAGGKLLIGSAYDNKLAVCALK